MNDTSSDVKDGKTQPSTNRTQWHRILGTMLELLLTRLGITVHSEEQVMSDPPKVDILLLRREGIQWTDEQLHMLCDGLRDSKARHLLVEFKYTESLTADALLQALGYDYFYRKSQTLHEAEVQTFVMVARTPHSKILQHFGFAANESPGVYKSQQPLLGKVQLIVLNQLSATQHNAFVQCFASQRRIYQNAFERIQTFGNEQLSQSLWALIAGLQTERDRKKGTMTKKTEEETLTAERLIEIGKETRKFVLATSSPEERLAGLAPEDRLAGLAPEDRLAGLAPEELEKLLAQIELFLQQQRSAGQ